MQNLLWTFFIALKVCLTPKGLERHQASGTHLNTLKLTSNDNIRKIYTEHVKDGIAEVEGNMVGQNETREGQHDYVLPCGWALKATSKRTTRSPEVRAYIQAIFDLGQATNEKANAVNVSKDMRTATDDKGNLLFEEKDWLQPSQVKNLFSTMAKEAKKPGEKRLFSETDFDQDSDAENEDHSQQNDMLNYIIDNTTGMTHPVIFQNINLCQKKGGLKRYGEKKLQSTLSEETAHPTVHLHLKER